MKRNTLLLGMFSLVLITTGCGPAGLPVVHVTGKVTLEGEPVEGASVTFNPMDSAGRLASGSTDTKGEFLVITQGATKNGCLPGSYCITVSKYILVDARNNPAVFADESEPFDPSKRSASGTRAARPIPKSVLPDKYRNVETSELNADVTKRGTNTFVFELTK